MANSYPTGVQCNSQPDISTLVNDTNLKEISLPSSTNKSQKSSFRDWAGIAKKFSNKRKKNLNLINSPQKLIN